MSDWKQNKIVKISTLSEKEKDSDFRWKYL